jgi:hypothetical protein
MRDIARDLVLGNETFDYMAFIWRQLIQLFLQQVPRRFTSIDVLHGSRMSRCSCHGTELR